MTAVLFRVGAALGQSRHTPDVLVCGHRDDDPAVFHTGPHGDAVCSHCCPTCTPTGDTDGR